MSRRGEGQLRARAYLDLHWPNAELEYGTDTDSGLYWAEMRWDDFTNRIHEKVRSQGCRSYSVALWDVIHLAEEAQANPVC